MKYQTLSSVIKTLRMRDDGELEVTLPNGKPMLIDGHLTIVDMVDELREHLCATKEAPARPFDPGHYLWL